MKSKEKFSARLLKAMEIRNMKASELAERTGLSRGAIGSYMTGRWEPKETNTNLISNALRVNPAWLLGYDVSMDKRTSATYSFPDTDLRPLLDGAEVMFDGRKYPLTEEKKKMIAMIIKSTMEGDEK